MGNVLERLRERVMMGQIKQIVYDSEMHEVEIAYQFLRSLGEKQNYRIIIDKIVTEKGLDSSPQLIASIHTQINLDGRFVYLGQGFWGLREWTTGKIIRKITTNDNQRVGTKRRSLVDELEPYESSDGVQTYEDVEDEEADENDDGDWEE